MDINSAIIFFVLITLFVLVYLVLKEGKKRKNEIDLKDLYKKSKIKERNIRESKDKIKTDKQKIVEYEINKISDHNDIQEKIEEDFITKFDGVIEDANNQPNTYKFKDKSIDAIDGIGPSYKKKLNDNGIMSISDFVSASKEPDGLKKINIKTGIYSKLLEKWLVKADMLRIQGIRNEQIDQLIQIQITSTKQLAETSPEKIRQNLLENNYHREVLTLGMIKRWIRIANTLNKNDYSHDE